MSVTRLSSIVLFSAFMVLAAGAVAAQQPHISFADPVKMLDCNPLSSVPCFTASFNIVDDRGQPVGVDLGNNLVSRVNMTSESTQVQVFYAAAATQARHGRITMILVDISGSMARKLATGETRFQAARSALAQFLYDFRDGVDQVAIVPFESHNVVSTIQGAAFAQTRDEAERQVNSMPVPRPQNNTALFSAVIAGLEALSLRRKTQASDVDTLLVVMTDGTNDIRPGDDPGLLADSFGLEQAHNRVALSGIQVNAIGFGDPAAIDQAALRQISTRPPIMAVSADNLNQAINQTRKLFTDKVQVAFLTSWTDAASLAGKNVVFRATLDLADGRRLTSDDGRFETPQIGSPVPSGKAGPELLQALAHFGSPVAAQPGLPELLRPIFVFLGLGVVLLIAWFWIPRLIWPGQYMGTVALPKSSMKWSGPTQVRHAAPAAQGAQAANRGMPRGDVPPGFESDSGAPGQRTPRDATVVQPMGEATRIRLEREQK